MAKVVFSPAGSFTVYRALFIIKEIRKKSGDFAIMGQRKKIKLSVELNDRLNYALQQNGVNILALRNRKSGK